MWAGVCLYVLTAGLSIYELVTGNAELVSCLSVRHEFTQHNTTVLCTPWAPTHVTRYYCSRCSLSQLLCGVELSRRPFRNFNMMVQANGTHAHLYRIL